MRTIILILLAAAFAAGCNDDEKTDRASEVQFSGNAPSKPPAGLKPMGTPHAQSGMPRGHGTGEMPALPTPKAPEGMDLTGMAKAEGGYTIAELYAGRADLSGKIVKVRGRVVKFRPEIMGTNWVHVQDGTGAAGANDLTVTTSAKLSIGDLVLIEGPLAVDLVLGHGMQYPVLVREAKIKVETVLEKVDLRSNPE